MICSRCGTLYRRTLFLPKASEGNGGGGSDGGDGGGGSTRGVGGVTVVVVKAFVAVATFFIFNLYSARGN